MLSEIEYQEEGIVRDTVSAMIMLFIGIGVVVLVVILVGVIGGKAYETTQADIAATVVDLNTLNPDLNGSTFQVAQDINSSILGAFSALADAAGFLGIIILALVFFLVLVLLSSGMQPFTDGGGRGAL